jgi:hypothetical protein
MTIQHVRERLLWAAVCGVIALAVSWATLTLWQLPITCRDLFFPDPPSCERLLTIRTWVAPLLTAIGGVSGWVLKGMHDPMIPR